MGEQLTEKKGSSKATYLRLRKGFHEKIGSGKWSLNKQIPSEKSLAAEYNVSRQTIRKALRQLELEGLLRAEQGKGRVVVGGISNPLSEKDRTIGMAIASSFGEDTFGELASLHNILIENNFNLKLYTVKSNETTINANLSEISKQQMSGLLVYCQQILYNDIIEFAKYLPTVALFHNCAASGIPSYFISWDMIGYESVQHLIDIGCTKIVYFVSGQPFFETVNYQFVEGFAYSHYKQNRSLDKSLVFVTGPNDNIGSDIYAQIFEMISKGEKIGVFAYYHKIAIQIINWGLSVGFEIGNQLAVITSGDSPYLNNSPVPVTAFEFDRKELVAQGASRLVRMIAGTNAENETNSNPFYGKLIVRASTQKSEK